LKRLIADTAQPVIARATAIWYLGQFPTREGVDILKKSVRQSHPLIKKSAARALASLPGDIKKPPLTDLLADSLRAVRVAATQGLAEFSVADFPPGNKQKFKTSISEYEQYLELNQYFPGGLMNRGQYYEKQGQMQEAIDAYRGALQKDPEFTPARVNLAYLYNERGEIQKARSLLESVIEDQPSYGPAYYSLALLISGQGELRNSIQYFEKAAELMQSHARSRYNLAIVHQKLGAPEQAEKWYKAAIDIAPETPDYHYGITTLYMQQKQYEQAMPHVQKLTELQPNNRRFQRLRRMVESRRAQ
jgi:tetratricopeptide (TPR) repeat protein